MQHFKVNVQPNVLSVIEIKLVNKWFDECPTLTERRNKFDPPYSKQRK